MREPLYSLRLVSARGQSKLAQSTAAAATATPSAPEQQALAIAPSKVDVKPVAHDKEIRERLQSVMDATRWFNSPQVEVKEGVVFLKGRARNQPISRNGPATWPETPRTLSQSSTGWM